MDKHKIIMVSGKQGSGKTAICNNLLILAARQNISAHHIIFADTIYMIHDYARELLRFRGVERPDKDGKLLQMLGTEWGRTVIGPDVWVQTLLGTINNIAPTPKDNHLFVVSDCRFKNEFDGIDAFRVRLEASEEVRRARAHGWRDTTNHVSETDLDEYVEQGKFDMVINTENTDPLEVAMTILKEFNNGNFSRVSDNSSSGVCGNPEQQEQTVGEGEPCLEDEVGPLTVEGEVK